MKNQIIIYNDKSSSFQDLLEKDKHQSIIEIHSLKSCKNSCNCNMQSTARTLLTSLNKSFIERNCNYNLQRHNRRRVNSVRCGTESFSYLSPKIWDI